jgi:hypothetical protein
MFWGFETGELNTIKKERCLFTTLHKSLMSSLIYTGRNSFIQRFALEFGSRGDGKFCWWKNVYMGSCVWVLSPWTTSNYCLLDRSPMPNFAGYSLWIMGVVKWSIGVTVLTAHPLQFQWWCKSKHLAKVWDITWQFPQRTEDKKFLWFHIVEWRECVKVLHIGGHSQFDCYVALLCSELQSLTRTLRFCAPYFWISQVIEFDCKSMVMYDCCLHDNSGTAPVFLCLGFDYTKIPLVIESSKQHTWTKRWNDIWVEHTFLILIIHAIWKSADLQLVLCYLEAKFFIWNNKIWSSLRLTVWIGH